AGDTQACGTAACASTVAANSQGRKESPMLKDMPGGRLSIEWSSPGQSVMMTPPADSLYESQKNH
ncbi:diaminopimelate epimerase, partial [Pseudomonas syringae pv. tagetis]